MLITQMRQRILISRSNAERWQTSVVAYGTPIRWMVQEGEKDRVDLHIADDVKLEKQTLGLGNRMSMSMGKKP